MESASPALWEALKAGGFALLGIGLSVLVGMSEVAMAFREDKRIELWRVVIHPWAAPLYGLYALLTSLIGIVLFENDVLTMSWTAAIALGLAGPTLFKTQVSVFRSISGEDEVGASVARLVTGLQQLCFTQINLALSRERVRRKERLARQETDKLLQRLRALCHEQQFLAFEPLIAERREREPASLKALIVDLIEQVDPAALAQALDDEP